MALLVGESDDFVLDRRAIARPGRLDLPGVHRRAVQIRADQLMRHGARVGQMTEHLRQLEPVGEDRERPRLFVAGRLLELRKVDGVLRHARRRPGLQPSEAEAHGAQRVGECFGGRLAEAAAHGLHFARVHEGAEECAGRDDDGARAKLRAVTEQDVEDSTPLQRRLSSTDLTDLR